MRNKLLQTKRSIERKTTQKFEISCVFTWFVSGCFPHLGIVFACLFLADFMWLEHVLNVVVAAVKLSVCHADQRNMLI